MFGGEVGFREVVAAGIYVDYFVGDFETISGTCQLFLFNKDLWNIYKGSRKRVESSSIPGLPSRQGRHVQRYAYALLDPVLSRVETRLLVCSDLQGFEKVRTCNTQRMTRKAGIARRESRVELAYLVLLRRARARGLLSTLGGRLFGIVS